MPQLTYILERLHRRSRRSSEGSECSHGLGAPLHEKDSLRHLNRSLATTSEAQREGIDFFGDWNGGLDQATKISRGVPDEQDVVEAAEELLFWQPREFDCHSISHQDLGWRMAFTDENGKRFVLLAI